MLRLRYIVYQTALEGAVENLFLMFDESMGTYILQLANGAGSHIDYFLVVIGYSLVYYALFNTVSYGFIEES